MKRVLVLSVLTISLVGACGGAARSPASSVSPTATAAPSANAPTATVSPSLAPTQRATAAQTATASGTSGTTQGVRIAVSLTEMKISPDTLRVPAGVPVTFVVRNDGVVEHEFFVGDEDEQAHHEAEMVMAGMGHDEPNGITVAAGATKELTVTFNESTATLAGCHVPGHYPAGMKASIEVGRAG